MQQKDEELKKVRVEFIDFIMDDQLFFPNIVANVEVQDGGVVIDTEFQAIFEDEVLDMVFKDLGYDYSPYYEEIVIVDSDGEHVAAYRPPVNKRSAQDLEFHVRLFKEVGYKLEIV